MTSRMLTMALGIAMADGNGGKRASDTAASPPAHTQRLPTPPSSPPKPLYRQGLSAARATLYLSDGVYHLRALAAPEALVGLAAGE